MAIKIYIDLDNTLIDTARLIEENIRIFAEYGGTPELYMQANIACIERWNMFNFERFYEVLKESLPDLPIEYRERIRTLSNREIWFDDAVDFLDFFGPDNLVLVTQGDETLQRPKIIAHNLEHYFGRMEILAGKDKSTVIDPSYDPTFFIDDAPAVIDEVKRAHPSVFCIQVRKPPPWQADDLPSFAKADEKCDTLRQAKAVIDFYVRGF